MMSIDMDSTAGAKAATKGSRRVQDDSYAALRDAAEKRRAQNRVAQRNSRRRNRERRQREEEAARLAAVVMAGQPTSHPIDSSPATSDPNSTPIQMATPPLSAQASDHFIPGHHRTHSWPLSFDMPTSSPMSTPLLFSARCTCSSYPCTCNFYSGDMLSPFTHFSTPPPDDLDGFGFQSEDPLGIHHPFGSPHSMPLTGIMPSDPKATPLMFPTLPQTSSHHASPFLSNSPSPSMSDLSSLPPASISGDGTDLDAEITWNMLGTVPNPPPNDASLSTRLGYVLDCMQRVGFRNFDEMATKYYTAQLEKNSAADLEQKISRSRRLKDFMASLRQSSQGWTRWESRGYCHEIIEGAEHMYVAELQRLLNRLEGGNNEDEKSANNAAHHGSTRSEQDFPSGASDTSDVPSLVHALSSRDENSPIPDRIAPNMSAKVARLFQNELPNLWALLMELSGGNGAQSEQAVLNTVSILYNSQKSPEMNIREVVFNAYNGLPTC